MFTGIISDIGILQESKILDKGIQLKIFTNYDTSKIDIGASISCNGICLTVVEKQKNIIVVEAWIEALNLTTIKNWQINDKINLEKSLKIGDELSGHLVFGHVDTTVKIVNKQIEGSAIRFFINIPPTLKIFIAPKGSICLDGTSLTINSVNDNQFDVLIISHSLNVTNWKCKNIGDSVNIEIDQLARYCVRYAQCQQKGLNCE